ncbi:MAG TPA: hypothetical protein VFT22_01370 [Kofleriaceae bacterium]|nr:hypothetical protein [Kofleriaceae bacterium]
MLRARTGYCSLSITMTGLTWLATTVACGPNTPPKLSTPGDQVAQVGTELTIDLTGSDPDGDTLTYGFRADDLADLASRAQIIRSPSGAGVFRWTPMPDDIGHHTVAFTASDDSHTATATLTIDVRSAVRSATAPVFRSPPGTGSTIDMAQQQCIDFDILVEDPDSPSVQISQGEPVIEGCEVTAQGGLSATLHWCPSREQQAESRYPLVLVADDGDNPKTVKNYLLVLRTSSGTSCPGAAPAIAHTSMDVSSVLDLTIDATITDDKGIKDAPLFYFSTTPPADPPDLSKMTQLTMTTVSGDRTSGVYRASVANPVAAQPAGSKQTLYYVFAANDDDDATGSCDHATLSQVYTMTVTSTGPADLPLCVACTSDAQCGASDECVRIGSTGATFCLQACGAGCPAGYTCSTGPITSVDGKAAPQCVPDSGSCEMPATTCMDDPWEVNDSRSDASHNPVLTPDLYDLVSCPSATSATRANDDWFKIVVPSDQRVDLQIAGDPITDLDLHLYHSDGTLVTASTSFDPNEEISACLPAATYYVKVNGFGSGRNPYLLSYDSHAESCNTTCTDDASEADDTFSQARPAFPGFTSTGNKICPNNDDWYKIRMFSGELLIVDLAFTQSTSSQDLDIHLYKDSLDLTPCDFEHPDTCSFDNGQSGTSNEHAEFVIPAGCAAGCDYFVVVRGYNHSSNSYAIGIDVL